jgi:hypothetical protein
MQDQPPTLVSSCQFYPGKTNEYIGLNVIPEDPNSHISY